MESGRFDQVVETVKGFYSRKDPAHDLEHALRVTAWAKKLAAEEGANSLVVELAALLHDIGRSGAVEKTHAESSAGLAATILRKYQYPEEVVSAVREAIITHSRERGYEPATLEAKVLYDADKLDFVGPVGIARLFAMAGVNGWTFVGENSCEEFYRGRIVHYRDYLFTESAQRHFEHLLRYMEGFWAEFKAQLAEMNWFRVN